MRVQGSKDWNKAVTQADMTHLHKLVEDAFPELDVVLGWGAGEDPIRTSPVFVRGVESISRLTWSPFCAQNLSGYLVKTPGLQPGDSKKKIGVCVKGCDSRSLVALIQEKLIARDKLHIFGIPCNGIVDWRRVSRHTGTSSVKSAQMDGDSLVVEDANGTHKLAVNDVLARKCLRCRYPNPVIHDVLIGRETEPRRVPPNDRGSVEELEEKSLDERLAFWQSELNRCMRCYACRNACPLCVCQDRCIAEARDPKWLTQRVDLPEKFLFHFIHTLHLAGRCTECGECERVCPMEIPVTLMREKAGRIVKEMLSYEAGLDPDGIPPLLTFDPSETGI
jgi:formate dehydrogenase subunit beta